MSSSREISFIKVILCLPAYVTSHIPPIITLILCIVKEQLHSPQGADNALRDIGIRSSPGESDM